MFFKILTKDKTIYFLDTDSFDIAKISTRKEIDCEVESKILTYLNKNKEYRDYTMSVSSFLDDYELSIGLFGACNLECEYCYGQEKNNSRLRLDKIKSVLESINKSNCKVQFVGAGEPLLFFDYFKAAVKTVKEYTKNIWLVTNGTLFTNEIIEYLFSENINITISMDGGIKEYQDKYRKFKSGKGTYEIIVNNLRKIQNYEKTKNKKNTKWISAVITNNNFDLVSLYKSFEEIPVDLIMYRFYMGNDKRFSLTDNKKFESNISEYIHFIFQQIRRNEKNVYRIINQRDNVFKYLIRLLNKDITLERCGAGKTKASLYSDGLLYLCDYCSGNKELALESFQSLSDKKCQCSNCNYFTLCGGYCKYENYMKNNFSCSILPVIINNLVIELAELQIHELGTYEKLKNHCKRISLYL